MFKLNFLSLSSTTTSCFDFLAIVVSDSWTNQNSSTFKVKEVNVVFTTEKRVQEQQTTTIYNKDVKELFQRN